MFHSQIAHCLVVAVLGASPQPPQKPADFRGALGERPNIVLVMTDDQGYGDLACHGNRTLKTTALDRLHEESIRLTNFHVDPTGAPTRAALLTGRYACRTGVWHTMMGRSLLRRDEKTAADLFAVAGYRTAVFGKWHLGDNYPFRAADRGFQLSLVHGGGGIGYVSDYWGNTHFDPVLCFNGKWTKTAGYCTDVLFTTAIRFIEANRDRPFFVYLPANVPHAPHQVAEKYSRPYRETGVPEALAAFYGTITNFDENMARLLTRLDTLGLADNTIVIFTTDNGTSGKGYNVEMRGRKGSAFEGGHRVPCFIRWPRKLPADFDIPQLTAHIDLLPTLMELANLPVPRELEFDGKSLLPLLLSLEDWSPRTLFVQSHRLEKPMKWRNSSVMAERYRVVNTEVYGVTDEFRLIDGRELFELSEDTRQVLNVATDYPKVVDRLRFDYEEWYKEVSTRFDEYCAIVLGSPEQNPTELTCFDWHGPVVPWHQTHVASKVQANGFWAVEVQRAGRYRFTLRERPAVVQHPLSANLARLKVGGMVFIKRIDAGASGAVFEVDLPAGKTQLQGWLAEPGAALRGAYFVEAAFLGTSAEAATPAEDDGQPPATSPREDPRSAYQPGKGR